MFDISQISPQSSSDVDFAKVNPSKMCVPTTTRPFPTDMAPEAEPYDDDRIVSLITQIYKLQQALCYDPEADSIIYRFPSVHQIDEEACSKVGLTPTVVRR